MRMLSLITLLALTPFALAAERPNIVVFLADDLGWGDLACYGHPVMQTPNLDAFAKQGLKLNQCYSASAVCSPSRSSILTGRTPHRNGVYTWLSGGSEVHLRKEEVTAATLLKKAGYATCHVGKWHLNGKFNNPAQPQPNDHGFDHWMATQNNAAPSHKDPKNFVRNGQEVGPLEGFSSVLVVDEAIDWLKTGRDAKKPFFLNVWTHEPHLPIESDPEFQKPYAAIKDADQRQHHGNVTQLDFAFGKLMKYLKDNNLEDNTLVIFTSDNGPEGNGNTKRTRGSTGGLRGRKRAMYEGGIRVAGMVRWPGKVKAGRVSDVPVIGSDIFPTILTAAAVEVPKDKVLDGANLVPFLTGQAEEVTRTLPLYWRLLMAPNNLHIAMRFGDYKLLSSQDYEKMELYNLKDDPQEMTDLSEKESDRFAKYKAALIAHDKSVLAEGPDWWQKYSNNGGSVPKKKQK